MRLMVERIIARDGVTRPSVYEWGDCPVLIGGNTANDTLRLDPPGGLLDSTKQIPPVATKVNPTR